MLKIVSLLSVLLLLISCDKEIKDMNYKPNTNNIINKSIYFGHQSVGNNILDGIKDINIPELNIHDFYIGENRNPISKIKHFENFIFNELKEGNQIDVATMKLCFVDITSETNIKGIFLEYVLMINRLKKDYPNLNIVHITVPLTNENLSLSTRIKRIIKSVLGKPTYDRKANFTRNKYNNFLRKEFPNETIFDLAKLESRGYNEYGSPALVLDFSDDGGHLNVVGRRNIAKKFIEFLNNI